MKNGIKVILILVAAIVLFFLGSIFGKYLLFSDYTKKVNDSVNTKNVMVAKEDIPEGTLITADKISIRNATSLEEDCYSSLSGVLGTVSTDDIKKDNCLKKSNIKEQQ